MKPEEFELARFCLQGNQQLIAAGKTQRWEVVKWAVTVNLALATVAATTSAPRYLMFFFCVAVAGTASLLLSHYNGRITKTRESARTIQRTISEEITDLEKLTGEAPYSDGDLTNYDDEERVLFTLIIWGSIVPALIAWMAALIH